MSDDDLEMVSGDPGEFVLLDLVEPAGWRPVPALFETAARHDRDGRARYDAGDYAGAGEQFLLAAELLDPASVAVYVDAVREGRTTSLRNAELAFRMAGDTERAAAAADQLP